MSEDLQNNPLQNNEPPKEEDKVVLAIRELSAILKHWIEKKYGHDKTGLWVHFSIVAIILIAIILLSCKLSDSIIGTLLGSLIGFSFGNFPKNNGNNKGSN